MRRRLQDTNALVRRLTQDDGPLARVAADLAVMAAAEGVAVASFDRDLAGFGDVEVNVRP